MSPRSCRDPSHELTHGRRPGWRGEAALCPLGGGGAGAEAGQALPPGRFWARNAGGVGACSQPGRAAEEHRALSAGSVGRLGNGRKPGGSGGGRMLSPERLSLPGPEYLGEERRGAMGQHPEGLVPWVCCGPAWGGFGEAGRGCGPSLHGLPGDSGEWPQARGVPLGWAGPGRSDTVSAFSAAEGAAPGGYRSVL